MADPYTETWRAAMRAAQRSPAERERDDLRHRLDETATRLVTAWAERDAARRELAEVFRVAEKATAELAEARQRIAELERAHAQCPDPGRSTLAFRGGAL